MKELVYGWIVICLFFIEIVWIICFFYVKLWVWLSVDVLLMNGEKRRYFDRGDLGIFVNKLIVYFSFNVN